MAIHMRLAADGFIHTPCPGPGCQVRFKIVPPKTCDHFHCPLAACGCRFAIARKSWAPAAAAPEPENVWAAVMDAVNAEPTAGGTLFERTRYPNSRRYRGEVAGTPAHTRWAGHAVRAAAVAAVLLLGIGLSIELLALAEESPELGEDPVPVGREPQSAGLVPMAPMGPGQTVPTPIIDESEPRALGTGPLAPSAGGPFDRRPVADRPPSIPEGFDR